MPGTGSPLCPPPPNTGSEISPAIRDLLARLDLLFCVQRKNDALIAHALAEAKRLDLHKALGYSTFWAFARERYQCGKSKTSELIAISLGCERLPKTRAEFEAGKLHWTKAREVVKVATPENEAEWLARASQTSASELAASRKGESVGLRRVLTFTPEEAARFDAATAGLKAELGLADTSRIVLAVLEGAPAQEESPVAPELARESEACQHDEGESGDLEPRAETETVNGGVDEVVRRGGTYPPAKEALVNQPTSAEEDLANQPTAAELRLRVLNRDRHRCQVPGCRNVSFLLHETESSTLARDPSRMLVLCEPHHRQSHEGWLVIDGEAPEFRFFTRTGVLLGQTEATGSPFSRENAAQPEPLGLDLTELVRRLNLSAGEREHALRVVWTRRKPHSLSAEDLVRAVLLAA